ncbi:MAG: FliH/SctL family protein [bacterium]|nr:FliH/SctL family protein [bacterium]
MWSRNLVKQFTVVESEEKRVIDTNGLVRQRMDEMLERDGDAELIAQELQGGDRENGAYLSRAQEEARQIVAKAREEAEAVLARAKEEAAQTVEAARIQADTEKSLIRDEAQKQGYSEGLKRAKAEEQRLSQEYREKEKQLEGFYQQQIDELEPRLVDTITDIYQHIFDVELHSYRDILTYLISSTLRKTDSGHDFMIHVSKEDYPYVNMTKKQLLAGAVSANCSAEVVEDLTLAKNECLIETENGIFDCGLGAQLSELKQKLTLLSWSGEE